MNREVYKSFIDALDAVALVGVETSADQVIVSAQQGPVWPNRGNSFWVSYKRGNWYLSTWLPAAYRIPPGQDLVAVCLALMKSATSAMYHVPEEVVSHFGLEPIPDSEFERLFPENDDANV